MANFLAYDQGVISGVFVALANVNGNGQAEIITGHEGDSIVKISCPSGKHA